MSSIKNRVSFIGIGQLLNALVNILLLPYLARTLEVDVYGTYGQVLLVCGVFQAIFAFGFSKLIYNYLNDKSDKSKESLVTNTIISCFLLSILGIAILYFGTELIASKMKNMRLAYLLSIYSLSILFNLLSEIIFSILNHFHKVKDIALIGVIVNLFRVGILIMLIQFGFGLENIFIGLIIVSSIQFIILWIRSPIPLFDGKIELNTMGVIISKGLPLSMSGITTILLVQTDGIMISSLIDTSAYAIYRMGAIPIPFLFIIYSSVITITMTDVTKYFHQGKFDEILSLKKKWSFSVAILIYPTLIFILVFAKEILSIYLGPKYSGSLWIFIIYNFILFLRITDYRDILIASGKTKSILITDLVVFLFNLLMNYFLIIKMGAVGAVIASIISYYSLAFMLQIQAAKTINARLRDFFEFGKLFKVIGVSVSVAFLAYILFFSLGSSNFLLFFISLLYIVLVYFALIKLKIVSIEQLLTFTSQHKILFPLKFILSKV